MEILEINQDQPSPSAVNQESAVSCFAAGGSASAAAALSAFVRISLPDPR
jgi:hypothetical protein